MALRLADPDQDEDRKSDPNRTNADYDQLFNGMADNYHNEAEHPLGDDESGAKNPLGKKNKPGRLDQDDLQSNEDSSNDNIDDIEERAALDGRVANATPEKTTDYFVKSSKAPTKSQAKKRARTAIFGVVGGGGIIMSLIIGMFMFLTIYRSEHLRNLLWDYRFARFHRQIAKRIQKNLDVQQAGGFENPTVKDLKITKNLRETTPEITAEAKTTLAEGDHTSMFREDTRALLRDNVKISFGDRFKSFQEKLKAKLGGQNREPTEEEKTKALTEADIERAKAGSTAKPNDALRDAADAADKDVSEGRSPPRSEELLPTPEGQTRVTSETVKKLQGASSNWSSASTLVFAFTMGCIVRDLSGSLDGALRTRIESPQRLAANLFGTAEQTKSGNNVDTSALAIQDNQLTNAESSAEVRLASNPDTNIDSIPQDERIEVADLPFTFYGMDLRTIAAVNSFIASATDTPPLISLIPGVKDAAKVVISEGCKLALNPYAQMVIAGADVVLLIVSLGTTGVVEGVAEAAIAGLKAAVSVAAGVGIFKIVFEYIVPKILFSLAGGDGVLSPGDKQAGNKLGVGSTLLAAQYGRMAGSSAISTTQASRDQAEALAYEKKIRLKNEGMFAYINPSSPYSILGRISLKLPGDPKRVPAALMKSSLNYAFSLAHLNNLPFISNKASAESVDLYTYGIQQYGIPDSLINEDPIENAKKVEGTLGGLSAQIEKYSECFTRSLADDIVGNGGFDRNAKEHNCSDDEAQRLGLYLIDNCTGEMISSKFGENCNFLPGAGDVTTVAPSSEGGFSDSGEDDGTPGVPADCINSNVGTDKTVRVQGIVVQSCIGPKLDALLNDARSAGINLSGFGWRDIATQKRLRVEHGCANDSIPASECTPPTAKPGRSMHEKGLAIDFTSKGAQVSSSSPAFAWMKANAAKYGFYNLPSEPWHWSVNGR